MVAVLLFAVAVVGWFWLGRHSAAQNRNAAAECVEGPATLAVTVDPAVSGPVRSAADRFNATKPHVRDHCVTISVNPQPSAAMVAGFTAKSWDTKLGAPPALWIPDSSRSVQSMRIPGVIEGTPEPVAVSPIVLAVPDQLRQALTTAKTSWADLPTLVSDDLVRSIAICGTPAEVAQQLRVRFEGRADRIALSFPHSPAVETVAALAAELRP